jgi:Putative zinc-finger
MERPTMDHNEALRSEACEKYLLGELPPAQREAYEEHYFSCPECAAQLRCAVEFLGASREIFTASPIPRSSTETARGGASRFAWFRPVYAAAALAALLLLIGYQNLVTIPKYKRAASSQILPMHSLITAATLGDESLNFKVPADQPFGLEVDVPYDPAYSTYLVELESPSGGITPLRSLTAAEAQKTQIFAINPGSQSGKYTIVVSGLATPSAAPSSARETGRLQFTVEVRH